MTSEGPAEETHLLHDEFEAMARRLHDEFDDALGSPAVEYAIAAVMEEFGEAKVLTFVPVMAERAARQRLRRLRAPVFGAGAENPQGNAPS